MSENEILEKINEKLDKVIIGLYGSLDQPGSGFIATCHKNMMEMGGKVGDLVSESDAYKDNKRWAFRTSAGAIIVSIVAMIKAFFFDKP